jgi:predicted metal-dependent phosphoesterase TrpH
MFSSEVDLHAHSTRSDGLLTPAALIARAAERGVKVFALTDHDDIGGLAEARASAESAELTFINGVEISVTWAGQTLHVVGLCIDPEDAVLVGGLNRLRMGRAQRAQAIATELARAGVDGSLEGARRYVTNPELVGRTHFARYLVERGFARDVSAVFKRFLASDKPGYVPHQWASLEEALGWIRASGGFAVLAHPGRYKLPDLQRDILFDQFKQAGGVAVEVVTGSHTPDQYVRYARYAQRFGLLASVGSDFHGPGEGYRDLGELPGLPHGCTPIWSTW